MYISNSKFHHSSVNGERWHEQPKRLGIFCFQERRSQQIGFCVILLYNYKIALKKLLKKGRWKVAMNTFSVTTRYTTNTCKTTGMKLLTAEGPSSSGPSLSWNSKRHARRTFSWLCYTGQKEGEKI